MLKSTNDGDSDLEIKLSRTGLEISQMYAWRQAFSITCMVSHHPCPSPTPYISAVVVKNHLLPSEMLTSLSAKIKFEGWKAN